ncbi:MAG TPA: redoxin family protein [Terriglobales bacterium]|nr:redoxin family protein [Terriglobales bacterium]
MKRMAQFEPLRQELGGASLVYVAAEKRGGMFRPEKFLAEHPVSYPFLLDEDRRVTKAYGVYHALGRDAFNIAHPATFVVNREGKILMIYVGMDQHDRMPVQAILEVLHSKETK